MTQTSSLTFTRDRSWLIATQWAECKGFIQINKGTHTFSISALLTSPAPGDVGLDEQRPPEASKYPQQDEGGQLHQMPRGMKLHVEQHQAAVSKRVDGAQGEGCDQGGEERTPQGLQREVITHLTEK